MALPSSEKLGCLGQYVILVVSLLQFSEKEEDVMALHLPLSHSKPTL